MKKLNSKQKKLLDGFKETIDRWQVLEALNIGEEELKFWRKTNSAFDHLYLETIGMTRRQERFLEILPKKMLNVAATCRAVNIHRSTYYEWVDKSDTFKRFLHEVVEGLKDDVETILFQKIFVENNLKAWDLYAKAKMRDRGYGKYLFKETMLQKNVRKIEL